LRHRERRLSNVIRSALDAMITIDSQGRIVDWNDQAERVFGWSRAEAVGQALVELIIPPHLRDAHRRGLARFLETGQGRVLGTRVEFSALRRDGTEIPVEVSLSAVALGDEMLFSAFLRDI